MAAKKNLVLAGASRVGRGTPWGTLCEVVARAIGPRGYECRIEARSWGPDNGRWVADGRADLGAWHLTHMINAYDGTGSYLSEGPRSNLRVIAHINHPAWLGVAERAGSGISDLGEIVPERKPARLRTGGGRAIEILLEHYGITGELLESFGGSLKAAHEVHADPATAPTVEPERVGWVSTGDFDVIVDSIYTGFPPEIPHWSQAAIEHDLEFLPLPEALVEKISAARMGTAGFIPHRLLRGIWADVPSLLRLPHGIYCRSETPEELVAEITQALDEERHLFRECHLNYSYDPANVAVEIGVPLHASALAYYQSVGIPTSRPQSPKADAPKADESR